MRHHEHLARYRDLPCVLSAEVLLTTRFCAELDAPQGFMARSALSGMGLLNGFPGQLPAQGLFQFLFRVGVEASVSARGREFR